MRRFIRSRRGSCVVRKRANPYYVTDDDGRAIAGPYRMVEDARLNAELIAATGAYQRPLTTVRFTELKKVPGEFIAPPVEAAFGKGGELRFNPYYLTDKTGKVFAPAFWQNDEVDHAWAVAKELNAKYPDRAPFQPKMSPSEHLTTGDIITGKVKEMGPLRDVDYTPPPPAYPSVRPYRKGKVKRTRFDLTQENPNVEAIYLHKDGFQISEMNVGESGESWLRKMYGIGYNLATGEYFDPKSMSYEVFRSQFYILPKYVHPENYDQYPDMPNPAMRDKPSLWYPKKGSEAAKDIGSILKKMRKATVDEKVKLKELFRATRKKWMDRERGELLGQIVGAPKFYGLSGKKPVASTPIAPVGPTERSRKAKNPWVEEIVIKQTGNRISRMRPRESAVKWLHQLWEGGYNLASGKYEDLPSWVEYRNQFDIKPAYVHPENVDEWLHEDGPPKDFMKNPDSYDSASAKALARTQYGQRTEIATEPGFKVCWSNGAKCWMRWHRPIKRGDSVFLDANEIILYGKARFVDALAETLPFLPLYKLSTEARERGPEHESLSNPALVVIGNPGGKCAKCGGPTTLMSDKHCGDCAEELSYGSRDEARPCSHSQTKTRSFRGAKFLECLDCGKVIALPKGNPGLLGQIAAGVAANALTTAMRDNPWKFKDARRKARELGLTLLHRPEDNEYEVRPKGARGDAKSYFTNDLDDAMATAEDMAKRKNPYYITDKRGRVASDAPFRTVDEAVESAHHGGPGIDEVRWSRGRKRRGDRITKKDRKNPYYLTNFLGQIVNPFASDDPAVAQIRARSLSRSTGIQHNTRFSGYEGAEVGDYVSPAGKVISPFGLVKYSGLRRRTAERIWEKPNPGAVPLPKRLERQVMSCPASDRPELLKGITKYYEFHGAFPPRIVVKKVDHAKAGYPKVNVGLGFSSKVDYQTVNPESKKFFAGGEGRYEHKFGEGLKRGRKGAKPLLVTDPSGTTLHHLPSQFKVKDWIHH